MTSEISSALLTVEAALQRLGRRVLLDALRVGIDADRVRSLLAACGLPSAQDVEALYAWRDGTQTTGVASVDDIHLFPGFYLLSLEDAVANYRAFVEDSRWAQDWLPLFANGGGDFYLVELSGGQQRAVRHFRLEEAEHPVEFLSLTDMIDTLAVGFDRLVFFVDSGGYLEMDDLAFAALASELNPEVGWWME
jgi:hypothetical protein